jgi:tRNA modification GTPase
VQNLPCLHISALTGEGLDNLTAEIQGLFSEPTTGAIKVGEIITNTRQLEAITRAESAISEALTAIKTSLTPDVVLTEIEAALHAIGEVTGKSIREDIVSRIFERFCVGK